MNFYNFIVNRVQFGAPNIGFLQQNVFLYIPGDALSELKLWLNTRCSKDPISHKIMEGADL